MFPVLLTDQVEDQYAQENFLRISNYFEEFPIDRCSFHFFEKIFTQAETNFRFPHSLTFVPKDVILLHNYNNVSVTWRYSQFNFESVFLDVGAATTLRFLLGRHA